jgi:hypothetical protein
MFHAIFHAQVIELTCFSAVSSSDRARHLTTEFQGRRVDTEPKGVSRGVKNTMFFTQPPRTALRRPSTRL